MLASPVDAQRLAADWLRALGGRRSQVAVSRRFGDRSNIAYRWESARCVPSASGMLQMLVPARIAGFYRATPAWLSELDPCSVAGVARLLSDLRGDATLGELARRTGYSRVALNRGLHAKAQPRHGVAERPRAHRTPPARALREDREPDCRVVVR